MKLAKLVLASALTLVCASHAFALDASATVKVTPVLKTSTSWDGKQIEYPSGKAEITGLIIELAPGGETGWHLHPVPSFALMLEGELEISQKDGTLKKLKAGDALAEVVNTLHNGRNVGTGPVRLVVFYAGTTSKGLSESVSAP